MVSKILTYVIPKMAILAALTCIHSANANQYWNALKTGAGKSYGSTSEYFRSLPEELQQSYLLNFATESPQFASPSAPRIIPYGPDAKLLLGVAGAPEGEPNSNLIEVIGFYETDPLRPVFKPHLISVDKATGKVTFIEDPNTVFYPGHPRSCARCHGEGENFKPIDDSYRFWRNTYGSGLDSSRTSGGDGKEESLFDDFRFGNGTRGIYSHLKGLHQSKLLYFEIAHANFTNNLNILNERRIFGTIADNPIVAKYSLEILYVLMAFNEPDVTSIFSAELKAEFDEAYPRLLEQVRAATVANYQDQLDQYKRKIQPAGQLPKQDSSDVNRSELYARLKFFMDKAGVSMDHWPMTLKPGTYSLSDAASTFSTLSALIFEHLVLPRYPVLAKSFKMEFESTPQRVAYPVKFPPIKEFEMIGNSITPEARRAIFREALGHRRANGLSLCAHGLQARTANP